ncbi:MAG: anthranilate phosphoribosyltransferase [Gammaproteobacteria bacterium]|nr:anthranilate phosphoribosyltransferase [Gammaproteobacteria bacterium]
MVSDMNAIIDTEAQLTLRSCIQKVATGPEYSKDLSFDEARAAMCSILSGNADPVQAAVFFIGLRMKRETDAENKGVLQGIIDTMTRVEAPVDELVDVADPYDGFTHGLPASPFLPAVLAACGVPAISHGLEAVGPKFGVTHRKVLRCAGVNVDLTPTEAALRLGMPEIGWAYVDQRQFCAPLHDLVGLRQRIVKRQVLTTVETLVRPVCGRVKTHLLTGYVHKAYPPVYAELGRYAGFDSALIVRGVEGGVTPTLQQPGKVFYYHDKGAEQFFEVQPEALGIHQSSRAVPIPKAAAGQDDTVADTDALAQLAAEAGLAALKGQQGPTYDSLVYTGALTLTHLQRYASLQAAADAVRGILNSGAALAHFQAGR